MAVTVHELSVSSEPATKQDIADAVKQLDTGVSLEIANTIDKATNAIRDSQTAVLKAFSEMTRSVEIRLGRLDEVALRLGG